MTLKIIHKHSQALVGGAAQPPVNTDLEDGELGINYSSADPALFIVDSANVVRRLSASPNKKFALTNDDANLVGGDATAAINAALISAGEITGVAALGVSDQVEITDSGNPDANANVTVGRYWYDGAVWFEAGGDGGGASVTVGDAAPASPAAGDLWWDSSEAADSNGGRLYLWYEDGDSNQWVQTSNVGGGGGGGSSSVTVGDSPPASPSAGDLWWDSSDDGGRLWVWYEDGDTNQWVEASPSKPADQYWVRSGTTLEPATAGDSVDIGSGNIQLNADGSAKFGKATSLGNADNFNLESTSNGGSLKVTGALTGSAFASYYVSGGTGNHFTGQYADAANFQIDHLGNVEIGGTIGTSPNIALNADGTATFARAEGKVFLNSSSTNLVQVTTPTDTEQVSLRVNGDVAYRGTLIPISDASLKENIEDAGSQWADIKAIQLRNYTWIDEPEKGKMLGVIAQELEKVCPLLISKDEDELKRFKLDPLVMKMLGALQESQTRIEALEAEVQALKGGSN